MRAILLAEIVAMNVGSGEGVDCESVRREVLLGNVENV